MYKYGKTKKKASLRRKKDLLDKAEFHFIPDIGYRNDSHQSRERD